MNEELWCPICKTLTTHTYTGKYKHHNMGILFTCTICKAILYYALRNYSHTEKDLTDKEYRTLKDAIALVESWDST